MKPLIVFDADYPAFGDMLLIDTKVVGNQLVGVVVREGGVMAVVPVEGLVVRYDGLDFVGSLDGYEWSWASHQSKVSP